MPVAVTEQSRIKGYKTFVSEGNGQPPPWRSLKNQLFPGDDDFVEDMQAKLLDSFPAWGNSQDSTVGCEATIGMVYTQIQTTGQDHYHGLQEWTLYPERNWRTLRHLSYDREQSGEAS